MTKKTKKEIGIENKERLGGEINVKEKAERLVFARLFAEKDFVCNRCEHKIKAKEEYFYFLGINNVMSLTSSEDWKPIYFQEKSCLNCILKMIFNIRGDSEEDNLRLDNIKAMMSLSEDEDESKKNR